MTPLPTVTQRDLIDGAIAEPALQMPDDLADANTGEVLARQRRTAPEDLERALVAADRVHRAGAWSGLGPADRAGYLRAAAGEIARHVEEIAVLDAVSTGVPIAVTRMMAGALADTLTAPLSALLAGDFARDLSVDGRTVRLDRVPWGPAAVLVPWNAPLGVAATKVAYGLAAGCPVILKAPEWAPLSCTPFAEAMARAGLPDGVFQLVHGGPEVGRALVADPRIAVISFTGGTEAGRDIARVAAGRLAPVHLELSGNNPAVVLPDADPDATAGHLAAGVLKLNGQWCEAPRRVLVPEPLHDDLVAALLDRMSGQVVGSSLDEATTLGPLSHRGHLRRVTGQIDALLAAGATAHRATAVPTGGGSFLAPTVITDVQHDGNAGEIFGPVLLVTAVPDTDTAVAYANDTPYGLAGYVFGHDVDRALRTGSRLRAGEVKINGTSLLNLAPGAEQSFFGLSGIGGHGAAESVRLFTGARMIGIDDPAWPI